MRSVFRLLFLLFVISGCRNRDENTGPVYTEAPKKDFVINGRLLNSCDNPTPIANQIVTLEAEIPASYRYVSNIYSTTDSNGNFTFRGYHDIPEWKMWYGNAGLNGRKNRRKILFRNLTSETYNIGGVVANLTMDDSEVIRCLVRYDLKHSSYNSGDTVYLDYHLLSKRNSKRIYTSKADFDRIDTIYLEEYKFNGLLHPRFLKAGQYNLSVKLRTKDFGNELLYAITNNCNTAEITVSIP
jgi:hypothetical protein